MTSSLRSPGKGELNGGQIPLNGTFSETSCSLASPEGSGEIKNPKGFRYFSLKRKNTSRQSDSRQPEKPLRKLSFKSVALTIQKFLTRVSLPKSSEKTSELQTISTGSSAGPSADKSTNQEVEDTCVTPSKPNWNSVFSGIRNHGNTCFLNAVIQCLSHTDLLAKYFVLDSYKEDLQHHRSQTKRPIGHGEVTERLAVLIKSLWTSRYSAEISSGFKTIVGKHGVQYRGALQHDAQEFLLWLLDAVHEDINRSGKRKNKAAKARPENSSLHSNKLVDYSGIFTYLGNNQSFILDVFQALLQSSLTCPQCGKQSITFDPYLSLSLPIPQRTTCPMRMTYIRSLSHARHTRIAVNISMKSCVIDLLDNVARLMSVSLNALVLTEIYSDGFRRTFQNHQPVSIIHNSNNLYVFELPDHNHYSSYNSCERPTLLMQSLIPKLPAVAILVINCEVLENGRLKRFGAPFSLKVRKDLSFLGLQVSILKAMSNLKWYETSTEVFALRVCVEGRSGKTCYLSSQVDHPLYQSIIEESLKYSESKTGPHVKMVAEWSKESRERYVCFDPNEKLYDIHPSVEQVTSLQEEPWMVSIDQCLKLYTQEEELSGDDAWLCPNCKQLQKGAKKQLTLNTTPDVLIIHLKRFKQLKTGRSKLHLMVDFPVKGLDMTPYMDQENHLPNNHLPGTTEATSGKQIYDLYAVCNHLGNMSAGHYTAVCKNPVDGQWYSYDDFRVARIPEKEIVTKSAYLLFYVRRNDGDPTASVLPESPVSPSHWLFDLPASVSLGSSDEVLGDEADGDLERGKEVPDLAEYYVSRKFESDTFYTSRLEQPLNPIMSESCV